MFVLPMVAVEELSVGGFVTEAGVAGTRAGVGGPDDAGEGDSTTHILDQVVSIN
jgi:hypothetical protein